MVVWLAGALLAVSALLVVRNQVKVYRQRQASRAEAAIRGQVFDELRPVALTTCRLERFGEPNDGGYLVCGNLLGDVRAGYSYGISGYDQWGCDVATKLRVPVHEYTTASTRRYRGARVAPRYFTRSVSRTRPRSKMAGPSIPLPAN